MYNDITICPYNPEHRIFKSRMFSHLQKCCDAKRSGRKTLFCKKDSSIRFFDVDKSKHLSTCEYCHNSEINFKNSNYSNDITLSNIRNQIFKNQNDESSVYLDLSISEVSRFDIKDEANINYNDTSQFIEESDINIIQSTQETTTNDKQDNTILY